MNFDTTQNPAKIPQQQRTTQAFIQTQHAIHACKAYALHINKFRERHREKQRETLSIRLGLEVFLRGRRFSSTDQSSGSLKGVVVVVTNCNWLSLRLLGSSSFLAALSVRSGIGFDDCDDFPFFFLFMVMALSLCSPLFQQNKKHE